MTQEDIQKKVAQLQMTEQRLQNFLMQKQNFQGQLLEIENALTEAKDAEEVYRIFGQIMIKADKDKLNKELGDKKDLLDKRISEIDKQEAKIREEIAPLQEEVMGSVKDGE
jgi:prefoldin beta subunit